jgi:predicted adenylyl cyclase CyaB
MSSLEIEIKSLLGTKDRADVLRDALLRRGALLSGSGKQLNHYFEGGDITLLAQAAGARCSLDDAERLQGIATKGAKHSVRTRNADGTVSLVVKASLGDHSSANGVSRMEVEVELPIPLDALDALVQEAGYRYQAKWSREREEYRMGELTVTIDRNAGYGYLAEFERVVPEGAAHETIEAEIRESMKTFGVEELPQDRLERMFTYYNAHWPEYYGSDRSFIIE